MPFNVFALFDDPSTAREAVTALTDAGFSQEKMAVLVNDADARRVTFEPTDVRIHDPATGGMGGMAAGVVVGGALGFAVGLVGAFVPGVGMLLGFGPIAGLLGGNVLGALTGGLLGVLANAGVDERLASVYAESVRRGGTLVMLDAPAKRVREARRVLAGFGPVDPEERVEAWRGEGWRGFDAAAPSFTSEQVAQERARWRRQSDQERPVAVIGAQPRLAELEERRDAFRAHFARTHADADPDGFALGEGAYWYGHDLSHDRQYRGLGWAEVEPWARAEWEAMHGDGSFDRVAGAVLYGFELGATAPEQQR